MGELVMELWSFMKETEKTLAAVERRRSTLVWYK